MRTLHEYVATWPESGRLTMKMPDSATASEFAGKTVVITGACGIYGTWIAEAFAKAGAHVCLTDRRDAPLELTLREINASKDSHCIAADLSRDDDLEALADQVAARWGAPDILVNNAGIYPSGFLLDIRPADWDRIMNVNLRAPFILSRSMARLMIAEKRRGAIVNISSGAAGKMRRSVAPYCISKTALDRLTKGFALELAEYGIRVNAVEPGFVASSTSSTLTAEHVSRVLSSIPLGRPSVPEDLPAAIMFLCSQAASYVTGATLAVDGGNAIGSLDVYQEKKHAL